MALGGKRWYQMSGKITTRFQWLWSQMGPYRTDIFALAGHPDFLAKAFICGIMLRAGSALPPFLTLFGLLSGKSIVSRRGRSTRHGL